MDKSSLIVTDEIIEGKGDLRTLRFLLFLLIYTSKDSFFFGVNSSSTVKLLGYILTILIALYLFFGRFPRKPNNCKLHIAFLSMLSLMTLAVNFDFSIKYFYEILLFFICATLVRTIPFSSFRTIFVDIIYFLAVFSFVFYILFLLGFPFGSVFPTIYNENNHPLIFCGLTMLCEEEYGLPRNFGIFREPGVYIVYLCIALFLELFSERQNFKKVTGIILALLVSFSTAGYIVALLIFTSYILSNKKVSRKTKIAFLSVLAFFMIVVSLIFSDMSFVGMVFGKLFYENDSTSSRTGSIIVNTYIFSRSFMSMVFGVGYTFIETEFSRFAELLKAGENNTNTILKMLAVHGAIYTSIIYYYLLLFCRKFYKRHYIALFLALLMLHSNEDMIVSLMTYLFSFYAINSYRYSLLSSK